MKNYKVKATRKFKDLEEMVERVVGAVFECTEARYEFLKKNNAVELVEIQKTIDDIVDEVVESKEIDAVIDQVADEIVEEIFNDKPKKKKTSKK